MRSIQRTKQFHYVRMNDSESACAGKSIVFLSHHPTVLIPRSSYIYIYDYLTSLDEDDEDVFGVANISSRPESESSSVPADSSSKLRA